MRSEEGGERKNEGHMESCMPHVTGVKYLCYTVLY